MKQLVPSIKILINPNIYVKDPETSELGRKILKFSILLIDDIGFEHFTFKKLGEKIGSNESSIYRYFENKHKLLLYLCAWYWSWTEYKLVFATTNIVDPFEKIKNGIMVLTEKIEDDSQTEHINEKILYKIIVKEFLKTIHTREIDSDNKEGFFRTYKNVVNRFSSIILEACPDYLFPKSLATTIIEGSLHLHFTQNNLKTITDFNLNNAPCDFYNDMVTNILKK